MTLCPLKLPGVPLPENMLEMHLSSCSWNDVAVDLATFRCDGPVVHELNDVHETRLSVLLEEVGGRCELRLQPDQPCPIPYFPRHMTYGPVSPEIADHTACQEPFLDRISMRRASMIGSSQIWL